MEATKALGAGEETVPEENMTTAEVQAFLRSEPPYTAKVATARAGGRPHVAPVWFDLDDEDRVVFTTGEATQKGRNLARDPRVSVCVDDQIPPFSFVVIEGVAKIDADLRRVRTWAARIGGRYMGADQAEAYGTRNGVPGELLVTIEPTRVVAVRNMAS